MALELPAVQGEGAALRRHRLPGPQGGWFTATGSEACRRARVGRRQTSSSPALPVTQDSSDIASHQSSVSSSLHGELSRRTHTQDPPSRPLCANRTPRRAPPLLLAAAGEPTHTTLPFFISHTGRHYVCLMPVPVPSPPSQSPDGRHAHPGNEGRRPNSKALPSANSAPGLAPFSLSGAACCHPTRRA